MGKNKESFWAKITGLSERELETEVLDDFINQKNEIFERPINNYLESDQIETNKEKDKEEVIKNSLSNSRDLWLESEDEGQLAIDVYQNKDSIIIKSAIAGVNPADLDVAVSNGVVTIRGERKYDEKIEEKDYLYQECYWGKFSRSVILPCEVDEKKIKASLKDGILTVILPKSKELDVVRVEIEKKK